MRAIRITGWAALGAAVAWSLSATTAAGAVGDLTYVQALPPGVPAISGGVAARKPADPAVMGLKHPDAMVVPENSPVKVAFDSDDPNAEHLDLARIDRTGKGDFKSAETVRLKQADVPNAAYYMGTFEPQSVEIVKDGQKLPVVISGRYYKNAANTFGVVYTALAAEGECKFGDTVRKVCVLDQNNNGAMGDVITRKVGTRELKSPDLCVIADENGQFSGGIAVASTRIGQPVQVAGKWYTLRGADMKIAAEPLAGEVGKLAVNAARWQCMLMRDGYAMNVTGGPDPAELPPGDYQIRTFRLYSDANAKGTGAFLSGSLSKELKIASGETTTLALGSEIVMDPQAAVSKDKDKVTLSARLLDSTGAQVTPYGADGKRPAAPQIDVIDQAGKTVYTATLAYG